jgi:hypothetical protein
MTNRFDAFRAQLLREFEQGYNRAQQLESESRDKKERAKAAVVHCESGFWRKMRALNAGIVMAFFLK